MEKKKALKIITDLQNDKKVTFCTVQGIEIYLVRPSKLPKGLKNEYDQKKNFQIWLKEGVREFKPNHLRIMIDLALRHRCRSDLKKKMLIAFDNIFYGKDPDLEVAELEKEKYEHFLNPLRIIANLAQLFLIEQEFNYNKESKFDPKTLFLQGWIREFIDSPKEIDNMCMSVCSGQPPKAQYVAKENKKSKKHIDALKLLWYLENVESD